MNSTVYAVDEYGNEAKDVRSGYVGEFKKFGFSGVPKHCLACDGSAISRTTYSELFEVFGETYGAGDGETTFNLPDFRGAFLRCIGGNAAALGVEQGDATAAKGLYLTMQRVISDDSATIPLVNTGNNRVPFNANGQSNEYEYITSAGGVNPTTLSSNDIETRPINYTVNVCVVYE